MGWGIVVTGVELGSGTGVTGYAEGCIGCGHEAFVKWSCEERCGEDGEDEEGCVVEHGERGLAFDIV